MTETPGVATHLIFDCDGVLVDTEIIAVEVESMLLTEAGFPISADDIAERYVGLSYRSMFDSLAERFGREVPGTIGDDIQTAVRAAFPDRLESVRGMAAFLERSSLPRAVASSSDLDRVVQSLELTSLDRHFEDELVLSAQMVERGKPEPDIFLLAAERLEVDASRCLVVEDSPHGVTAARRAGMTVVGLLAGRHARPSLGARLVDAGADFIATTVAELDAYIHSP